jgi:hypothetical protein
MPGRRHMGRELVTPRSQGEALQCAVVGFYPLRTYLPCHLALFYCQRVDKSCLFASRELVRLSH